MASHFMAAGIGRTSEAEAKSILTPGVIIGSAAMTAKSKTKAKPRKGYAINLAVQVIWTMGRSLESFAEEGYGGS
jgi:hypothetical protein